MGGGTWRLRKTAERKETLASYLEYSMLGILEHLDHRVEGRSFSNGIGSRNYLTFALTVVPGCAAIKGGLQGASSPTKIANLKTAYFYC